MSGRAHRGASCLPGLLPGHDQPQDDVRRIHGWGQGRLQREIYYLLVNELNGRMFFFKFIQLFF